MKKLVFSILLFGLAGLGGLSLWAGMTAQRQYREAIGAFADQPDVRILESSFERGWIRSHAETEFELHGRAGDAFELALEALGTDDVRPRIGFHLSHRIEHGPWPLWEWLATGAHGPAALAEVSSVIELDHESRAEFGAVIGRLPSVDAHTVIRSDGSGETRFSAPGQLLEAGTDPGPRTVVWRGLQGSLLFAPGGRSVVGTVRSPGFDGEGPNFLVSASGIEWHLDVREGEGLPLGENTWHMASLRIESAVEVENADESGSLGKTTEAPANSERAAADDTLAEPASGSPEIAEVSEPNPDDDFAVLLRGLVVGQSSRAGAGRYSGAIWLEVERIELGAAVYGPGELRLALTDVDATALRKLRRTTRRIEAQAANGKVSADTASAAIAGEMMQLLPELLARSPRLELESLALGLPSGNLRGSGTVWFDGKETAPVDLFDVLAGLGGELDVEAPALSVDTFAASLPAQVENADSDAGLGDLRKRGLLIRDGGVYRMRVRYRGGQLTINGLPFATVFPGELEADSTLDSEADELPEEPGPTMAQLLERVATSR